MQSKQQQPLSIPPSPIVPCLFKPGQLVRHKGLKDAPEMFVKFVHHGTSTCFWYGKNDEPFEHRFQDSQLELVPAPVALKKKGGKK
jgi:hypothetical protein